MTRLEIIERLDPAEATPAEPECIVACVLARTEQRFAWLSGRGAGGPAADMPAAEATWLRSDPAGRASVAAVTAADGEMAGTAGRFDTLAKTFMLNAAERNILLTTLAARFEPALAEPFQRLTGRPWVTEALVQRLFGHGLQPIWDAAGALAVWELVTEEEAPAGEPAPLRADPVIGFWVGADDRVDAAFAAASAPFLPPSEPLTDWPVNTTADTIAARWREKRPVRLVVRGGPGSGRASFAAAVAARLGHTARAMHDWPDATGWRRIWMLAQRSALVTGATPIWRRPTPPRPLRIPAAPLNAVTAGPDEVLPEDGTAADLEVVLPPLGQDVRRALLARMAPSSAAWPEAERTRIVARAGTTLADFAALSRQGDLTAANVEARLNAAHTARLGDMASRMETAFTWEDIILPPALTEALRDLAFEAAQHAAFWERPDVRRLFGRGRGLAVLFAGPSGAGKTMAAQVIAREMGVDLFRIDLASITSKYIGETSRNLRDLFRRAAGTDAVLLFDEADALFAQRTEVKDSRDRYANADTGYLLQQLEAFEGIAILSTNKKANIDTAFLRRLRYVFDFPRPGPAERRRLWHTLAPIVLGLTPDAAMAQMLDRFGDALEITGAQTKGALVASHFAARRHRADVPDVHDLMTGVERELAKEGRTLTPSDRKRLTSDA